MHNGHNSHRKLSIQAVASCWSHAFRSGDGGCIVVACHRTPRRDGKDRNVGGTQGAPLSCHVVWHQAVYLSPWGPCSDCLLMRRSSWSLHRSTKIVLQGGKQRAALVKGLPTCITDRTGVGRPYYRYSWSPHRHPASRVSTLFTMSRASPVPSNHDEQDAHVQPVGLVLHVKDALHVAAS